MTARSSLFAEGVEGGSAKRVPVVLGHLQVGFEMRQLHLCRRFLLTLMAVTGLLMAFWAPSAAAEPEGGQRFTDIGGNERFAGAVLRLADEGIVYGRADGSFSPYDPVTRGELAVYLNRILNLQGTSAPPFADVTVFDWYSGAVAAMYEAGLISGTTPTSFSPNMPVSRQQAAALLLRSLEHVLEHDPQEAGASGGADSPLGMASVDGQAALWLAGFQDRALIAEPHVAYVANAYRLGIMEGAEGGWFYPALALTRAQMVIMLDRAFYQPVAVKTEHPAEVPAVSAYPTQKIGSEGALVVLLESQLDKLRYPCGEVDGVYDERTRDAVMAFEKVERLSRDGIAGPEVWQKVFGAQTPAPRLSAPGTRLEVDLTRQVVFVVRENVVTEIIHCSTGKVGTPPGHGKVWLMQTGWQECSVGWMFYPCYFYPHIAIHGSSSVPPWPASHGCIRTPNWIAPWVYSQLSMGMSVDVY